MIAKLIATSLLLSIALTSPAFAQDADEVLLGPISHPIEVNGVAVTPEINSYFKVVSKADGLYLDARVEANLKDLQAKIGSIIDKFPVNKDNCVSYKPDNILPSLSSKSIVPKEGYLTLELAGRVEIWSCFENPIPATKLVWKVKKIGFFKTKVPVIETSKGSPLKTRTISQSFKISTPAELKIVDETTAGLIIKEPTIKLEGDIATTLKVVGSIFGMDLDKMAKQAIDKAVDPEMLIQTIPEEYKVLQPKIKTFKFSERNGELLILMNLSAKIPAEKINEFVLELVKNSKK